MGLGRFFGRGPSLAKSQPDMRATPDDDGVTRVFSKELWDDPKIGSFLTKMGRNPDDPDNRVPTAEEYKARFARSLERLRERTAAYNAAMTAKFGHCNARPFLIIDAPIWDGPNGAFLYGQLDLYGYDEWNILLCAADAETIANCGLVGHPGTIQPLTDTMNAYIAKAKTRHAVALDAWGASLRVRPGGDPSVDRAAYEAEVAAIRVDLLKYVDFCKMTTIDILKPKG